ncbi:hypothetical protein [Crateriforma conspicua]|uniref:Uncharacterized protein n=1 Tax=Crateriforma conspicua TaxID=2527996 RepID=A0A5C5YA62_9PLAN|nr:hypothetical protein [Crateriforma conspicua]TWT71818.1 hypothetical protein Pan14r_41350 [Crateriforma conspicua]
MSTLTIDEAFEHDRLSDAEKDQWAKLQKKVRKHAEKLSAQRIFGDAADSGVIYRWGVAAALRSACPANWQLLSRLAATGKLSPRYSKSIDLVRLAEDFCDDVPGPRADALESTHAVLWAAAMPWLTHRLPTRLWWDLLGKLQHSAEQQRESDQPDATARLILGGELGLTMAWRLKDLPSCHRMRDASVKVVKEWLDAEGDAIADAMRGGRNARLVAASLLRCEDLFAATTKSSFTKRQRAIAADAATWVAGLTSPGGQPSLLIDDARVDDSVPDKYFRDDVGGVVSAQSKRPTKQTTGLLERMCRWDPETLRPAVEAALGVSHSGGRLAWSVSLPESLIHCDDAKLGVMLPEWDVRRGRTVIDYSQPDCRIEMCCGRKQLLAGQWQTMIRVGGIEQTSEGDWESTCEYSDDDVHYLEFEQPWSGGLMLQRHVMLLRDDRCAMLADSVLPSPEADPDDDRLIQYVSRLPLAQSVQARDELETREVYLHAKPANPSGAKTRKKKTSSLADALAIPLSAGEWRVGPSAAQLDATDDGVLVLTAEARSALFAPLWLDLMPKRFKRKRTWRTLTIADELKLVPSDQAGGFRVQMGSEQWIVYRSLRGQRVRSVMGKHLIADFFAARFHMDEGDFEELVTVEGSQDD